MKTTAFLLTLLLGVPGLAVAEDKESANPHGITAPAQIKLVADSPELEEYVKTVLRPNVQRIAAVKKWERVEKKENVADICLGDATLTYYYSDKGLEKIVANLTGETYESTLEYYFLDKHLSFIEEKREEFEGGKQERRGYFKGDECFRVLGNKGKKLSPDEMKEWLLDEQGYRQYATYLAILKQ